MTYEEALNTLRDFIGCLVPARASGIEYRRFEAFAKAIEALEKQIPKKIVKGNDPFWEYQCPNTNCDTQFARHASYEHCPNCGQAIDWSEVE